MSVSDLRRLGAEPSGTPGVYHMQTAPEPHNRFDLYTLVAGPRSGLCSVRAGGVTLDVNDFGEQLIEEFQRIREAVASKYGRAQTYDYVRDGSLWDAPRHWMMGLEREDRTLATYWLPKEGASLPANLQAISLRARALNVRRGYVALTYEFSNFDQCKAEIDAAASNPF